MWCGPASPLAPGAKSGMGVCGCQRGTDPVEARAGACLHPPLLCPCPALPSAGPVVAPWPRLSRLCPSFPPFRPPALRPPWTGATGSSTPARAGPRHHPLPGRPGCRASQLSSVGARIQSQGSPLVSTPCSASGKPVCLLPSPTEAGPGQGEDGGGELTPASGGRGGKGRTAHGVGGQSYCRDSRATRASVSTCWGDHTFLGAGPRSPCFRVFGGRCLSAGVYHVHLRLVGGEHIPGVWFAGGWFGGAVPHWVTLSDPGVGGGCAWVCCGVSFPPVCGSRVVWVLWSNSVSRGLYPGTCMRSFLEKSGGERASGIVYIHACACDLRWWLVCTVYIVGMCCGSLSGVRASPGGVGGVGLYIFVEGGPGSTAPSGIQLWAARLFRPFGLERFLRPGPSFRLLPLPSPTEATKLGRALLGPVSRRRELRLKVGCPCLCQGSCVAAVSGAPWGDFTCCSV